MKIGKDSVVMGSVPANTVVGDGSVIIGPTDAHGNVRLNGTMAVGRGARAGPGTIAIGAFAGAGARAGDSSLAIDLQEFADLVAQQTNGLLIKEFETFRTELARPAPDRGAVMTAWEAVKAAGSMDGTHSLLVKITTGLATLFGG